MSKTDKHINVVKRIEHELKELYRKKKQMEKSYQKNRKGNTDFDTKEKFQEKEYNKLHEEIEKEIARRTVQLKVYKIAALRQTFSLTKSAKKAGFLTNDEYSNYLESELHSDSALQKTTGIFRYGLEKCDSIHDYVRQEIAYIEDELSFKDRRAINKR